jgi:hypothetical protein
MLLRQDYAQDLTRSLALLALHERRADVLELCTKRGVVYNSYAVEDEANWVDPVKDPRTEAVLEGSEFRRLYPRRLAQSGTAGSSERVLKEGGRDGHEDDGDNEEVQAEVDPGDFDEGGEYAVDW